MKIPRRPIHTIKKGDYKFTFKTPFDLEIENLLTKEIFLINIKDRGIYTKPKELVRLYMRSIILRNNNKYHEYVLRYINYLEKLNSGSYLELTEIARFNVNNHRRIKM